MKPVVAFIRKTGIFCVVYLDDWIIFGKSKLECDQNVKFTVTLLESLGFIVNYSKSVLSPSTECKFLGFDFNSDNMTIALPLEKRLKILNMIIEIENEKILKIRKFARLIGLLVSACPAIKYGWLYTKSLERLKNRALLFNNYNYDAPICIQNKCNEEFSWWKNNIIKAKNNINQDQYDVIIYSDSSKTDWGAVSDN